MPILTMHFNIVFLFLEYYKEDKVRNIGSSIKHIISKTLHDIENIVSVSSTVYISLN